MGPRISTPASHDEATATTTTEETPAPQPGRTRRSLLAAGLGAAGAFVASAIGRPAPADAASVVLGATNNETAATRFHNTAASSSAVGVVGRTTYTGAASSARGVVGISEGIGGIGVVGEANTGVGARGVLGTSTSGTGVRGISTASNAVGVHGTSTNGSTAKGVQGTSTTGIGVHGEATGNGYGVRGSGGYNGVYGNGGSYGVIGSAGGGYGVYGSGSTGVYASGGSGGYGAQAYGGTYGVYAAGASYGVYAEGQTGVYGNSGSGSGVWGNSSEPNSAAVYGTGGQYGVLGLNGRTAGVRGDSGYVGVWGQGTSWGFFSIATGTSGQNYGIMSETLSRTTGFAGWFKGNVQVEGTVSKSAGNFLIDHPLDPDRRWLSHSFVESPDMMNVYNGTVVLDAAGRAKIQLPDYFEALNRDFRYQLTPIGAAAPSLHVARKVERNEFQIAGGSPGQEISWQITGIRQDDYANEHRIQVDTPKSKADQGTRLFVAKGSGAKQMEVGPRRPTGLQPAPAKVEPPPAPVDVQPRAPAD
jgi:hypothetical protein